VLGVLIFSINLNDKNIRVIAGMPIIKDSTSKQPSVEGKGEDKKRKGDESSIYWTKFKQDLMMD
jgi:hypothetical protein